MRDNMSYAVVLIGGFLLGAMLTGGLFGTYLLFGSGRHRAMEEAMVQMEADRARLEAETARMMAEQQEQRARLEQHKAEERLRELEEAAKKQADM